MNKRWLKALELRDGGATFSAISRELGVSRGRAKQIYDKAVSGRQIEKQRSNGSIGGLSTRAFNCLVNFGLSPDATRGDVRALMPRIRREWKTTKNFGAISLREIEEWLAQ